MSGPTREQVMEWARHAGMAGMITDVVATIDELERFAALAFAAGQAVERDSCRSIADDALKGASMSKYATSAECRAARDMAKKIEHRIRARGQK